MVLFNWKITKKVSFQIRIQQNTAWIRDTSYKSPPPPHRKNARVEEWAPIQQKTPLKLTLSSAPSPPLQQRANSICRGVSSPGCTQLFLLPVLRIRIRIRIHVFWAPWIRILLSLSKNGKKNLDFYVLWLLFDFLPLKNDLKVPSKVLCRKTFFLCLLLNSPVNWRFQQCWAIRDILVRIRIQTCTSANWSGSNSGSDTFL